MSALLRMYQRQSQELGSWMRCFVRAMDDAQTTAIFKFV
jgi:hypothetical protein